MSTPIPGWPPLTPLQAQYLALQDAIGLGAKVIRFQDRTIEYNSIADMIMAANYLYQKLAASGGLPPGAGGAFGNGMKRQVRMHTDKGL